MHHLKFAGLILATLLLASCASPAAPTPTPVPPTPTPAPTPTSVPPTPTQPPASGEVVLPEVNPLEVAGDIRIAGSSTVFPLAERMAERFRDEGYQGNITIDSIGSGAGFERFCKAGETDISNASRPIKDSEREACRAIGREPLEFRVGTDALAVVVSKENDFLADVTLEELAIIFSADAVRWSEVNPEWPDQEILRFTPGTDSGTFDYFVEEIFDGDKERPLSAPNLQLSEDDNVLVQGVLGSPYAVGYFGYAYYAENADRLRALAIEGVEPTQEAVDDGTYPLARPLFMYSAANIMREKPQVAAFLNFVLTYVNEEIVDVGYFPASSEALNAAKRTWLEAMGQ
ncbi:MAG: PstS family phosphate ABC transporter substrate-binding protein [Anaerolineae bacterium]|nr:PstS family phosphate ABC transporter substrate-binding protein [Anaerolineae bacterium]